MRYYIEMLARSLIDPTFIAQCYSGGRSPSHPHHRHDRTSSRTNGSRSSSSSSSSSKGVVSHHYSPQLFSNCLSASRQLENLICTNRESLIGSGAWNNAFIEELQTRPFYQATRCTEQMMMMLCRSGNSNSNDYGNTFDPMRCAACHRASQSPDTQVSTLCTYYSRAYCQSILCTSNHHHHHHLYHNHHFHYFHHHHHCIIIISITVSSSSSSSLYHHHHHHHCIIIIIFSTTGVPVRHLLSIQASVVLKQVGARDA